MRQEEQKKPISPRLIELLDATGRLARVGGWEIDVTEGVLTWTDVVREIHEVAPDYQPILDTAINFYAPEAVPVISEAVRLAIEEGQPFDLELQLITANQRRRWVRAVGEAVREEGKVVRVRGIFHDIHERKLQKLDLARQRAEIEALVEERTAELQRSREDLGTVMDSMDALAYVADMDTYELLFLNRYGREVFSDFELGRRCWEVLQEGQEGPCPFCTNSKLLDANGEAAGILRWEFQNTKNGSWFDCRDQAIPWTDGRLVRLEIATDVTQRKDIEEELRRHVDHLDTLVAQRTGEAVKLASELEVIIDAIPGLVFYKDTENRYLRVNRFLADAHGMSKADLEGKDLFDLYPREEAQAYLDDDLAVIGSGEPRLNIDEPLETPAGRRWLSTSKIPSYDETGKIIGIIGVSLDITERKEAEEAISQQHWLRSGQAELSEVLRVESGVAGLAAAAVAQVTTYVSAAVGALYRADDSGALRFVAGYAHDRIPGDRAGVFAKGQGLVGQAASTGKTLRVRDIPEGSVRLVSGLLEITPSELIYVPLLHGDLVQGVLEIGTIDPLTDRAVVFLESVAESIAISLNAVDLREREVALLEEAQRLTEELRAQQEELKTSNLGLVEQTRRLRDSESELQAQQEEMEVTNEELIEKNRLLELQKRAVEVAQKELQVKAEEVALASRYKSEFLANMSHELRTPLNSLLILAGNLAENREGNLTEDQVESVQVIHGGGTELLSLINEVLDLARIESGRMELHPGIVPLADVAAALEQAFRPLAREKGLQLSVRMSEDLPEEIYSDRQRLEQILRNLVGNAVKFTKAGEVTVTFGRPQAGMDLHRSGLDPAQAVAFTVEDTGIGIAPEYHAVVFEAFQQADRGTARSFGGTGLGLSISRDLAQLLSGEIQLSSTLGKGSTFTLVLPERISARTQGPVPGVQADTQPSPPLHRAAPATQREVPARTDDRDALEPGDAVILIIEDDVTFVKVLQDSCRDRGLKCLAELTGQGGLLAARTYLPGGVLLDLGLPDMDGRDVLAALKSDTRTRHIPVHVISAANGTNESLRMGAVGHARKPIDRGQLDAALAKLQESASGASRRVLLVEDDPAMRLSVRQLLDLGDIALDEVSTGQEAMEAIRDNEYSCIILDLGLPDMSGADLLERLQGEGKALPPVIVHTARDLTEQEEMDLRERAQSIVIKDVRSQERLLDEVSLFLHQVISQMPEQKRQVIRNLHETEELLTDKKVLLVDDDMRTTFAVSRFLAQRGMQPVKAANGIQALQALEEDPGIDLVLMDIMMPQMDGYEAIGRIREQARFRRLPIIALTAKAMPEDRQKCIDAGADDYLPKPVDLDRLISMMRVWLYR